MQPTYYTILPSEIRLDKRLSAFDKILYSDILALSSKKGYCYATNKYFAKVYQMSISTISQSISKLVEAGLIKRIYEYKKNSKMIERRKLYIPENYTESIKNLTDPLVENKKQGIGKKSQENNININNIKSNIDHTTKFKKDRPESLENKSDYLMNLLDSI